MNEEIFFERLNEVSPNIRCAAEIVSGNITTVFTDEDIIFELTKNKQCDIIKISLTTDDVNKSELFLSTVKEMLRVYSPETGVEQIEKELFEKGCGLYSFETDEYDFCSFINDKGLYFTVNNKKLNPLSVPELTININEDIRKTH